MKRSFWIFLCLLLVAGVWLFWPRAKRVVVKPFAAPTTAMLHPASSAPKILPASKSTTNTISAKTKQFAYRLTNTPKTIGQLASDRHGILLENALIDTGAGLQLSIPKHLAAAGDPGAFIVQAKGPISAPFRAALAGAGAAVVSYIPNNALLVRLSAAAANTLAANPLVQAVLPYEPYYKLQPSLLGKAVNQQPLPAAQVLTLGLFNDGAAATTAQIEKLGGQIVGQDRSPFGPILRVQPPADWLALVQLPGVQIVEPATRRVVANDLSRVTMGVATNTLTGTNYLGLTGKNVTVEVNDTGIDATHPDFTTGGIRVFGDYALSLVDTNGHGTHVAGIIAGNGTESDTVTNAQGSIMPGTNTQFRGMAPLATLFSVGVPFLGGYNTNNVTDSYLQETPAKTNALISNNSWVNDGSSEYDLSAASYDAAVRDAIPERTGPQPVLFVFAAGNDGSGDDDGGGGTPDSINSPGTAKNVITVGALEQYRNITNTYTPLGTTNPVAVWLPMTDSSSQVASYSARGNVGIGTEGTYGRFKPDVVAPGSFVVSTRSSMWDTNAYYNPTNYYDNFATDQVVDTNGLNYYNFPFVVKSNAVNVSLQITIVSPANTPTNMPIYVSLANYPDPATPSTYDAVTFKDNYTTPPDPPANYLTSIVNNSGGFNFGIGDSTNVPVTYDLLAQMVTTNDLGDYYAQLQSLNDHLGTMPEYYRYETGTSMSAAGASGVLALIQDFFTNTLHSIPSPALLKAMIINGSRPTGFYNFQVDNPINFEGWGLVNLPNSLPSSLTNTTASATNSFFFVDQSPTNTLATGDSRTYQISLSPSAQALPLRITLAWTDPPGNPAAAIKLVNNLDLIVTNTDSLGGTNAVVYYGNDIAANQVFNTQENPTNAVGIADTVNNVENVYLPAGSGTNFTIVIYGTAVNVNAVTTQTNNLLGAYGPNIVQDFALVVSSGNGDNTNGFAITASSALSNPTGDQQITVVTNNTPSPLQYQTAGANSPLLGTNTVGFGSNITYGAVAEVTLGMTNQWHFYIITNNGLNPLGTTAGVTNAAFVTFLPPTLSVPRGGAVDENYNSYTRPEADIDLFVASGPGAYALTNLDPNVISNCVNGAQVGASVPQNINGVFYGSALDRGGSEFVVDTNSTPGQVYYVGVKCEDQTSAEYDFLSEFSSMPFSGLDSHGNESVFFYPVNIPDGDATHPGYTNVIGLAIYPVEIQRVVVTNILVQQNVGDLVVSLNHATVTGGSGSVVLLNHDSPNSPGTYTYIYNDSAEGNIAGSQNSDGPGSLNSFFEQQGAGVWTLHVSDNAPGFVGSIGGGPGSTLFLEKHQALKQPNVIIATIFPKTWFYDYVQVPAGYTNLTFFAVDENPNPPFFETLAESATTYPTFTSFDNLVLLTNLCYAPPGLSNNISVGPPLAPGTYFVGVYNPDSVPHTNEIGAILGYSASAATTVDIASTDTPIEILDDAITSDYINVTNTAVIQDFNVGLRVDHPRISDLAFSLISPGGSRYLLMENRGAYTTNGCGVTVITTNIVNVTPNGNGAPDTNYINVGEISGSLAITYNFFYAVDEMTVYYSTNVVAANLLYDTGFTNNGPQGGPYVPTTFTVKFAPTNGISSTYLTIIMNQFGNPNGIRGTKWVYTAGGVQTNYAYLRFTEDTNLTTTPIKYAVPPFVPNTTSGIVETDSFEPYPIAVYPQGSTFGNWKILTNSVAVTNFPTAYDGSNSLALTSGAVSNSLATVVGQKYILQYALGYTPFAGLFAANDIGGTIEAYNLPNTNGINFVPNLPLQQPDALAFDAGGNLYVADFADNTIWRITPIGAATKFALTTPGGGPAALAFDANGNLYVANYNVNTIQKVSPAGVVSPFATDPGDNSILNKPDGLAFDGTGTNLYVANSAADGGVPTIRIFNTPNSNGTPFVDDPDNLFLNEPAGLAFDATGTNLYVANYQGAPYGSVVEFQTPSTNPIPVILPINGANLNALAFDNLGNLYISDVANNSIYEVAAPINAPTTYSPFTSSGLNEPFGLAYFNSNKNTDGINYGNWQLQSVAFTATQNQTPLVFDGSGSGLAANTIVSTNFSYLTLIDAISLTSLPSDLYYQAEQSLAPIIGTSAQGQWQLEMLDSRTGGASTNGVLDSWQLEFVFANTNIGTAAFGNLQGGVGATNKLSASALGYYTVTVPSTANFATNLLLSASEPVNVWFSTNNPPTISNAGDVDLIPGSTSNTNSPAVLGTNGSPVNTTSAYIYDGLTYYLVIQNLTNAPVTFNVQVNFDVAGQGASLHFASVKASAGRPQLKWSATRGAHYQIQWADQITTPMVWHTITSPTTTSANGVSTFTDNGTQTAPLGAKRFYRLVRVN